MNLPAANADRRLCPERTIARTAGRLALLVAAVLLGGCAGGGWARVEPLASLSLSDSRTFENITAALVGSLDRQHPIRPLVISGDAEQVSTSGQGDTAWQLLAFVGPSDIPARAEVIVLLGRVLPAGQVNWQLFSTQQHDAEYWSYMDRVMIYGRIQPGDRKDSDPVLHQIFSASLDGRVRPGEFRNTVLDMIAVLEKIRSRVGPGEDSAESTARIDDAIETLHQALGRGRG